jgi:Tol biopolymer transport system component
VWSGNGERVAFASNQGRTINAFSAPIDHSTPPEQLTRSEIWTNPNSWSPDGKALLVDQQFAATGFDVSLLSLDGERSLRPFLHTSANETDARFSPDGRWVAYQSDESGRDEVYVTPYPGPGSRVQISTDGGSNPVWLRGGRSLLFMAGGKLMSVATETQPKLLAGLPKPLFELTNLTEYDVAPDGRFVFIRSSDQARPRSLAIVLNWFDDLKRRTSAEKKSPPPAP